MEPALAVVVDFRMFSFMSEATIWLIHQIVVHIDEELDWSRLPRLPAYSVPPFREAQSIIVITASRI